MRLSLGPLAFVVAVAASGCGSDSGTTSVTGPSQAFLTSGQVTGNLDLTAVGQTSQLQLTGHYSDDSNRDITAMATWTSSDQSVVTVSNGGLVTAVGFGLAGISARINPASTGRPTASATVTVAPAGTMVLQGRVREPGSGDLTNVRVVEQISLTDTRTDNFGGFKLIVPPLARIRIELPDYEVFEQQVTQPATARSLSLDVPMQRMVRVNAGQSTAKLSIAPNDVSYSVGGDVCHPCKLIRVISGGPAMLTLRLTWTGTAGVLKLWANDTRNSTTGSNITVNVPTNGGQSLVYVGWTLSPGQGANEYVSFNLSVD